VNSPKPHTLEISLKQKLRNHAKATGDDVALILTRYVNERFLYRLSVSPHRDKFILRGATLFSLWNPEPHRATRDIDLLASGDLSPEAMQVMMTEICRQPVPPDGVGFLPDTLRIEARAEARVYQGLHLEMITTLGTARPRLEIDIAVGEAVIPPPVDVEMPVLLGMPPPRLRAYQKETAVAEKCEALVSLGIPNTRMKDFYDLWYLSRAFPFHGPILSDALHATFTRRGTPFPASGLPPALTAEFADAPLKTSQWNAFQRKNRLTTEAAALPQLIAELRAFLHPPLHSLADNRPFPQIWTPPGPWHPQP